MLLLLLLQLLMLLMLFLLLRLLLRLLVLRLAVAVILIGRGGGRATFRCDFCLLSDGAMPVRGRGTVLKLSALLESAGPRRRIAHAHRPRRRARPGAKGWGVGG
jgi:hypothetical protein